MTDNSSPKHTAATLLIAGLALLLGSMGGAVAGALVTSADIKDGAVQSKDIRDKTIKTRDLSPSAGARVMGYALVDQSVDAIGNQQNLDVKAKCPREARILGVSGYWETDDEAVQVFIKADGREATAFADNPNSVDSDTLHVRIVCGRVTESGGLRTTARSGK